MTVLVLSSIGILALGLLAAFIGYSRGRSCQYRREALVLVGLYLVLAGLMRVAGVPREFTGWVALWFALVLSQTAWSHWLFHRFLRKAGVSGG